MHLSLISDAYLSDAMDDAGRGAAGSHAPGRAHRDALLRGVVAICIAGTLLGLTFLSSTVRSAEIHDLGPQVPVPMLQAKIQDRIGPLP